TESSPFPSKSATQDQFTSSVAPRLSSMAQSPALTLQLYTPSSASVTPVIVSVGVWAPANPPKSFSSIPFRRHWYESGPGPATPTVNCTVAPSAAVVSCGWSVKTRFRSISTTFWNAAPMHGDELGGDVPPTPTYTPRARSYATPTPAPHGALICTQRSPSHSTSGAG